MTTVDATFRIRTAAQSQETWRPQPGQITEISTNVIASVAPPISELNGLGDNGGNNPYNLFDQSKPVYCKWFGQYGALVVGASGGHSAWRGNELYIFPINGPTNAWGRMTRPFPVGTAITWWADPQNYDNVNGEYLINGVAGQWHGNCPPSDHLRNKAICIPGGTNNQGRLFIPATQAYPGGTSAVQSITSHSADLGIEPYTNPSLNTSVKYWTRHDQIPQGGRTTPYPYFVGEAVWIEEDMQRVGLIGWASSVTLTNSSSPTTGTYIRYFYYNGNTNNSAPHWEMGSYVSLTNMAVGPDNGQGYCPQRKLLFIQRYRGINILNFGIEYYIVDLNPTPAVSRAMLVEGTPPAKYAEFYQQNGAGLTYCPVDGHMYGIFAYGSRPTQEIWRFRIKPDQLGDSLLNHPTPTVATWRWENLTAKMPAIKGDWDWREPRSTTTIRANHMGYNRAEWSDSIGAIVWCGGSGQVNAQGVITANDTVQLINPVGVQP